jgi:ArsR family transcriptional regulator
MDQERYSEQAELFKALMNPARIAILLALQDSEQCVCHLEAHLGYPQAYLSKQLALLRTAGLVADRRDGWNVYYRVVRHEVFALLTVAQQVTGAAAGLASPAHMPCPCPKCADANATPQMAVLPPTP